MRGFFDASANGKPTIPLLPQCSSCGLFRHCRSPKMPVAGRGKRNILIVGEGPGENEDDQGKPFVGKAGQFLRDRLRAVGIDADRDCWITNAIICRGKNRPPTEKEISFCRPNLVRAVKELSPDVIIPLGAHAIKSVIGWAWEEDTRGVDRWTGQVIPSRVPNAWIVPTWHPSYLLRRGSEKGAEVLTLLMEKHLWQAARKKGKPWGTGGDGIGSLSDRGGLASSLSHVGGVRKRPDDSPLPPDYRKRVEVMMDPSAAAGRLAAMIDIGKPIAFDLECDSLKPDRKDVGIICCAVSDGEDTIAFPWHGDAIRAMKDLLRSDVGKIGWNIRYETRWIKAKLGIWVRNWVWDGIIAAHTLDNRPGTKSLDYQAFVQLGYPPWDHEVRSFAKAKGKGGNVKNKMRECDLRKLMTYCGIDALLEWEIAKKQARKMGVRL